jgi:glutathione S-transferase
MKLYHSARSSASYRVRIAMACKGMPFESRLLDMQAQQHRSAEFLAINPLGLVPALDTGTHILTQSLAIIEYLEALRPEPALILKVNQAVATGLKAPEWREQLAKQGAVPGGNSPEQFAAFMKDEYVKWGALAKAVGAKIE